MLLGIPLVETALALVGLLLLIFYFRKKRDPRYPPGPASLPIIGNLLQIGSKPQETLQRWADEYGPAFSMKMGSLDVIVLNNAKMVRDVFQEASASGRSPNPVFLALSSGNYGIIMSEGVHWEQQRRFTLRKLRDAGFAKSSMEGLILEEVSSMCKWFEKRLDRPISGARIFNGAVVNALWNIVAGERNEWDAPEPPEAMKRMEALMGSINKLTASGVVFAPILRFIIPEACGWNGWLHNINSVSELTDATVQRHAHELDPNNPQDFIDHYLIEMENEKDPNSSFYKETGDKNLKAAIPDLFLAGSETTSHTLSWTMLFLSHNPEVQRKLQGELDTVVGQSRQPMLSDRQNLPYTEAVIMETLRRSSLVINGIPHKMLEDKVINGYFFPKNTTIMSNIYKVNNDPKVWGDPEVFRPERFLTPDGTKIVKHESFVPFALGKRQCLGMTLANDTLLLFTAAIFQKFWVRADPNDDGNAMRKIRPTTKMLNDPEPFRIIVSLRQ